MKNIVVRTSKGTSGRMNIFWSNRVVEGVSSLTRELIYAFPEVVYKTVMSNKGKTVEYIEDGVIYHISHYEG